MIVVPGVTRSLKYITLITRLMKEYSMEIKTNILINNYIIIMLTDRVSDHNEGNIRGNRNKYLNK